MHGILVNISKLTGETLPAPTQHVIRDSTDPKTFGGTCQPATAPKRRKTNTFANSEIASMLSKDFLGTTTFCGMFGYGTKVVWTSTSKMSDSEDYITMYPALAQLMLSPFFPGGWRRVLRPKVSNNAFGPQWRL